MTRMSGNARRLALLIAVALLMPAGTASGHSRSLSRPLHPPHVAEGAPCPTSHGDPASKLGHGLARMPVAGHGPVYLMSVADEPAGSVTLEGSRVDRQGWRGQKAPWVAAPRYRGPILIRGMRIDAPGQLRFGREDGERVRALYQRVGQGVQPNGWRVWPGSLFVRSPGCYALQVDGTSFSSVIVIRVHT